MKCVISQAKTKKFQWMLAYVVVVDDVADGCYYSIFSVVVVLRRCQ